MGTTHLDLNYDGRAVLSRKLYDVSLEMPRDINLAINNNTFSLKNTRFEAPRDLRGRKVQIRFDRLKFDRAIVYFKGERMGEARPVDFVANDRKPIRKTRATPHESYDVSEVEL